MKYLLILLLILSACTHMTTKQKVLMSCITVTQVGDYITTVNNLRNGGKEYNNFYGNQPNNEAIAIGKIITISSFYTLGWLFKDHQTVIYSIGCIIGSSTIIYNLK